MIKKTNTRLYVLVGVLFLTPVIYVAINPSFVPLWTSASSLPGTITQAKAAGNYPNNEWLQAKYAYKAETNAADDYGRAITMAENLGRKRIRQVDQLSEEAILQAVQIPARPDLSDFDPVMKQLALAGKKPEYTLALKPEEVATASTNDLQEIREFARFKAAEAVWAAQKGDVTGFEENIGAVRSMGQHIEGSHGLVGLLIRDSVRVIYLRSLEKSLNTNPKNRLLIEAVKRAAQDWIATPDFVRPLEFEAAGELAEVRKVKSAIMGATGPLDWKRRWTADLAEKRLVSFWEKLLTIARAHPSDWKFVSEEAAKLERTIDVEDDAKKITSEIIGAIGTTINACQWSVNQTSVLVALTDVAASALDNGKLPDALPADYTDYATGGKLQYKVEDGSAYVWAKWPQDNHPGPKGHGGKYGVLHWEKPS